jgi:hypothetical protein
MKNRIFILIVLGIVCLINGCIYSDDGIYRVDPVADDPPLVLASTNLDSIENPVVIDSLVVVYDISIQDGELYLLDVILGNQFVYESDTTQGSFWIYASDSEFPGIDTLKMNIYYSSNTNSLGDILRIEARELGLNYAIEFKGTNK